MNRIKFFDGSTTCRRLFLTSLVVVIIAINLFIYCSCRNSSSIKHDSTFTTYIDVNGFGFGLPKDCKNITNEELGKTLMEINPTINFIALVPFPFGNSLFSVSAYDLKEKTPIDSAFNKTLIHIAIQGDDPAENYRLVDSGIKNLNEKYLRYKISFIDDSTFNIMYYFMKGDFSSVLYEIKAVCQSKENIITVQDFLEKIALTVKFNDTKPSN
jgi:hypothetical protein